MQTEKVGIREFRDNLSSYLLTSESPVTITRHGDAVGHYIPVRRKRTAEERAEFVKIAARWQKVVDSMCLSEDEIVEDFKRWRKGDKQK
jgi:antitoxin (DNA-binding transcriptional repressor) of toxin-antitoxin stability system